MLRYPEILLGLLLATCPLAGAQLPGEDAQVEQKIVDLVNEERKKANLGLLQVKTPLQQVAVAHSEEMSRLNYYSHTSPTPGQTTVSQRLRSRSCCEMGQGELILRLSLPRIEVAQEALQQWLASPADSTNMLKPGYNRVGVGVIKKGLEYWVTVVLTRDALELTRITCQPLPAGFHVALEVQVGCGAHQGIVLHEGKKVAAWQADEKGHVVCEFDVPSAGKLELCQKMESGFEVEAEVNVP